MKFLIVSVLMVLVIGCVSQAKDSRSSVETASSVDLEKYLGTWYEVASIPQSFQKQCVTDTKAEYSKTDDGMIRVLNSCEKLNGDISASEGRAKVIDTVSNSKLKVTFVKLVSWIFSFGGSYWILDVDSGYNVALVGDPTRAYAWILSRQKQLTAAQWVDAEKTFKMKGYDTCKILTSAQKQALSERMPLCEFVKNRL